jgi:UDP-GlcNAc:undecaprenyl-phosphate GlcNAc-1-phosphate transferase
VISVASAIAVTLWMYPDLLRSTTGDVRFLVCLTAASIIIVGVGMLDDRVGLRGRQKLFGQMVAAMVMVPSGIMIRKISVLGYPIEFGDLSAFVTVFWILGAVNALNLIDGVDGLASTTGIVLSLSVAAVTFLMGGRPDGLLISLALAGSLTGFLIYNFPPARMFLGDSGSMLIGLVIGSVALKCSVKQYAAVALIMPTAIWAIPIFDVSMAILRRRLTGRSIYATDRGHLHHCLVRRGHTGARLLVVVAFLCSLTGLGAIAAAAFDNEIIAVVAVLTSLALLVVTRSFGHAELMLLTNRVRRFAGSLLPARPLDAQVDQQGQKVRLHGSHAWDDVWTNLYDFVREHELDSVELMINLPRFGEEFHASWKTSSRVEPHQRWHTEIPLSVDGMRAGHVKLSGAVDDGSVGAWMSEVSVALQQFELLFKEVVGQLRMARTNAELVESPTNPHLERDTAEFSGVATVLPVSEQMAG